MYTQKFQHHYTRNNFTNTLSKTRSLFESNFHAFDQKLHAQIKAHVAAERYQGFK